MPFITSDKRRIIDPVVDIAWARIEYGYKVNNWPLAQAGNLAYIIYRFMLLAVRTAGGPGWGVLTRVWSDVSLGAAAYFKRYEIDPYEKGKLVENGPVVVLPSSEEDHT